jgi:hypothetical protein
MLRDAQCIHIRTVFRLLHLVQMPQIQLAWCEAFAGGARS